MQDAAAILTPSQQAACCLTAHESGACIPAGCGLVLSCLFDVVKFKRGVEHPLEHADVEHVACTGTASSQPDCRAYKVV